MVRGAKDIASDRRLERGLATVQSSGFAQVRGLLRPGSWRVVYGKSPTLQRSIPVAVVRDGAEIPAAIDRKAYTRSGHAKHQEFAFRTVEVPATDQGQKTFQADLWLLRRGNWLFFDIETSRVLRLTMEDSFTDEYVELRRTFERHVPSAGFERLAIDRVVEECVAGPTFVDLAPEERTDGRRMLLRHLAELIDGSGRPSPHGAPTPDETIFDSPILATAERDGAAAALFGSDSAVAHVPVHGDLSGSNIVLRGGTDPTVIDFGALRLGPWWHDSLHLVSQDLPTWRSGGFDDALGEVWEAAGQRPIAWDEDSIRLAVRFRHAWAAHRRMRDTKGRTRTIRSIKRRVKAAEERARLHAALEMFP